ncbi:MAG: OmpA family protein [Pseudohongiella nitratireducens]|nr:OmpA family protein [Pseudohongiella nitratireducens]
MSNRYEIDLLDDDSPVEEGEGEAWMMSYLDVMTLLIAFFVLLLAMSEPKTEDIPRPETETGGLDEGDMMAANASITDIQIAPAAAAPGDGLLDGSRSVLPASNSVVDTYNSSVDSDSLADNLDQQARRSLSDEPDTGGLNQELADIASTLSTIAEIGIDASPGTQELTLRIDDSLLFFSGNAELRYAGMMLLKELTPILTDFSGQLSIEGHTDDLPINTAQFPSNWELSSARSLAVLRFLDDDGLDPANMRAVAYADSQPLTANDSSTARATNRRVEIVLREADLGS